MWLLVIFPGAFVNKNAISAASSSGNQKALGPRDFEFGFEFTLSSDEGGFSMSESGSAWWWVANDGGQQMMGIPKLPELKSHTSHITQLVTV